MAFGTKHLLHRGFSADSVSGVKHLAFLVLSKALSLYGEELGVNGVREGDLDAVPGSGCRGLVSGVREADLAFEGSTETMARPGSRSCGSLSEACGDGSWYNTHKHPRIHAGAPRRAGRGDEHCRSAGPRWRRNTRRCRGSD